MTDIFNETIICNNCNKKMQKVSIEKNGFVFRALQCLNCKKRIYHPADIEEYKKFSGLKNKFFSVKLRIIGNSYAVSIPKEIIEFMKERENIHKRMNEKMSEMVRLCMEEFGKLTLSFNEPTEKKKTAEKKDE